MIQITPYSVELFNRVLEIYLILLSNSSTILNFNKESVSSHYNKRSLLGYPQQTPTEQYIKVLTYTGRKSWLGVYGSVYYELRNQYYNYKHPSQLVNICFKEFINGMPIISDNLKLNILRLYEDETEKADYLLYESHKDCLREFELFPSIFLLDYIEDFFKEAFFLIDTNVPESDYVFSVIEIAVLAGLGADTLIDLSYRFVHQDLSSIELEVLNSLIERLKSVNLEEIKNERVYALFEKALRVIGIQLPNDYFTQQSYRILEQLAEPGGFNYLLMQFCCLLLNRAYCLTHSTNTIYSNDSLEQLDEEGRLLISRVARLLYYSGTLLKKSNLAYLNVYGNNLCNLLKIEDSPSIIKRVLV